MLERSKLSDFYYFLIRQLKNFSRALQYFKIGYFNQDWDYAYLLDLLQFKLKRMEKAIRAGFCENAEETANEVKYAIKLLKRITNNKYHEIYGRTHKKRWGSFKMEFEPIPDSQCSKMKISYAKAKTPEDLVQAKKEMADCSALAQKRYEQDLKEVFEFIGKNLQNWWD